MKARRSKHACEQLAARLVEELQRGPRTIHELAELFEFSEYAVRTRLNTLLADGQVHYVEVPTKIHLTVSYVWHIGPAPQEQIEQAGRAQRERAAPPPGEKCEVPKQETVRVFQPIGRRDPLVAALFGPAPAQHGLTQ